MRVPFVLATGELQFVECASLSGLAVHSRCVAMKPFFLSAGRITGR